MTVQSEKTTKYSKKLAKEILDTIEQTRGSLRAVLDSDPRFPTRRTFYRWREKYEWLENEYQFVCQVRDDDDFDEIIDIARENDGSKDSTRKAKLIIDAKKWVLARRQPTIYGTDKVDVTSDGKELTAGVFVSAEQAQQLIRARANASDS